MLMVMNVCLMLCFISFMGFGNIFGVVNEGFGFVFLIVDDFLMLGNSCWNFVVLRFGNFVGVLKFIRVVG